jgi:hypothetical protein
MGFQAHFREGKAVIMNVFSELYVTRIVCAADTIACQRSIFLRSVWGFDHKLLKPRWSLQR